MDTESVGLNSQDIAHSDPESAERERGAKNVEIIHKYVTKKMIKTCKLHACVDRFLQRLYEMREPVSASKLPDFSSFEGDEARKLQEMLQELQTNLNKLYPRWDTTDLLADAGLKVLKARWNPVASRMLLMPLRTTPPKKEDKGFFQTMQDVLLSSRIRQLDDYLPTGNPESSSLPEGSLKATCRQLLEAASASFTCGGEIPINSSASLSASPPVQIVWWVGEQWVGDRRLVLPLNGATPESSPERLRRLATDCNTASLGGGQENVPDPAYCNAGKLDAAQFLTNFHLSGFGIIESIEKVLLPNIGIDIENQLRCHKLTWDLDKLNVYSAPSGIFQKHVDAPRPENQIAFVVVCLPSPFKGGQLTVQRNGLDVEFDWSSRSSTSIQWAAFYTDCDHEIKQIIEGERITLTYNIYITDTAGDGNGSLNSTVISPETLAPYGFLRSLIQQPSFMKTGGVIGFYCSHAYPHASPLAKEQLPNDLKGSDFSLYSTFKFLGMEVDILPVLEILIPVEWQFFDLLKNTVKTGKTGPRYEEGPPVRSKEEYEDVAYRWKRLFVTRRVKGMGQLRDYARCYEYPLHDGDPYAADTELIGTERHAYRVADLLSAEAGIYVNDITPQWRSSLVSGVTWLNQPTHTEKAFGYLEKWGEDSIGNHYSSLAILAIIPPFEERQALLAERK